MLIEVLAILGVVLFIAGFVILFNRKRATFAKAFEDDADEDKAEPEKEETPEDKEEGKNTEIFASVDTSNTQDATGFGYDAAGESSVKNLSFEEKLGKDTVVVELPAPKTRRKAKVATPKASPVVKKGHPVKLGATPEELVKILERKIARRVDVLKVAKLPESGDATLKRYRSKLGELKAKIAETAIKKALAEKPVKTKKSSTEKDEVIRVSSPGVEKKTTKKSAKKAPAKKPAKKTTKKSKKSAK
jgi:hypothetical protein